VWQFGPYRVEQLIARGGMGEVLRAYDTRHDRLVALKLLHESIALDESFRERFKREAHAVARLREPHVIPIHAYGEIDGRLYLDMRLVDGEDVSTLLARERALSPEWVLDVLGQVADALDAAHAEGLVHRDVKPSNILISRTGFAYLVDFGITYSMGVAERGLTSTGSAVGTVDYMAPERFTAGAVDQRADVYSLACVLYQCVTGEKPFAGETVLALAHAHLSEPPPVASSRVRGLPRALDEVIACGMAKDPGGRFTSARALINAAWGALRSPAATAVQPAYMPLPTGSVPSGSVPSASGPSGTGLGWAPVEPPRRSGAAFWGWTAAAILLVAALGVGAAYYFTRDPSTVAASVPAAESSPQIVTEQASPSTVTRQAPTSTVTRTVPTTAETVTPPTDADLGLATPMSTPACDGSAVVIAASAVDPSSYSSQVQGDLQAFPGSSYLHAPTTGCTSLRQRMPDGSDIYSVYYGPYSSVDAACAQRAAIGGDSYVKTLDNVSDPSTTISCD
jgi:serine/threonine-protein kinase